MKSEKQNAIDCTYFLRFLNPTKLRLFSNWQLKKKFFLLIFL